MSWLGNMLFGTPDTPHQKDDGWQSVTNDKPEPGDPWPEDKEATIATQVDEVAPDNLRDASGQKIIPEVEIEMLKQTLSSDMHHLDLWARVKNHSSLEVEVTQVHCLKQQSRLGRFLKPSESHEVRIYSGDTPRNDAEQKCEVVYKVVQNGDYFQADHHIRYKYEQHDGEEYYVPEDMDLIRPIRDV